MTATVRTDLEKVWEVPKIVCPVGSLGHSYKPFDHREMHGTLAEARRAEPVFYSPDLGYWFVTRYADVLQILQDPQRFSAANVNTPISPVPEEALAILRDGGYALEGIQVHCDPPRHTRIRNSAVQLLNVKHFMGLESGIRELVNQSLDEIEGRDEIDLLADFTYELPAKVIFRMLGIPASDAADVKRWATNRLLLSFSRPTHEQQVESARNLVRFWHYCVDLVAARQEAPRDDFPSGMLALRGEDDSILTVNEINSATFGLLFAGHETTTSQITNTIDALLSEGGAWSDLCAEPSLIPNAVEEGLRLFGAVVNWRRRTTGDAEIAGTAIPAGSNLVISFTSANRDEAVFADPDRFDPRRKNARKHLTFGHGIHVCLGAPLARLEMKIMLEELTRRFPNMRRLRDKPVNYAATFAFRAPESLWVKLR